MRSYPTQSKNEGNESGACREKVTFVQQDLFHVDLLRLQCGFFPPALYARRFTAFCRQIEGKVSPRPFEGGFRSRSNKET